MSMEAARFYDLLSASCRTRKSDSGSPSLSPKAWEPGAPYPRAGEDR